LISEGTIDEGMYSIGQEKLKLEQDLNQAGEEADLDGKDLKKTAKKDVSRLLKIALDFELNETLLGDVEKVYSGF
jgi:hypothetical protein